MTYARNWFLAALMAVSMIVLPAREANAQWAVLDVANLGENILTALQTMQSNVNEAQQIANQIQQLNNEFQNLQKMPGALSGALLGDYIAAWNKMTNTFAAINGLSANIGTLAVNYNNLFPARGGAPLSGPQVIAQLQQYLAQAPEDLPGGLSTERGGHGGASAGAARSCQDACGLERCLRQPRCHPGADAGHGTGRAAPRAAKRADCGHEPGPGGLAQPADGNDRLRAGDADPERGADSRGHTAGAVSAGRALRGSRR